GETSMASGTLDPKAYLVVGEDGTKEVYLNFHGLVMNETAPDEKAYMGALWNKDDSDVTYYDYETDASGKLLDNAGFDAVTEFACVKSVKINISDDTWNAAEKKYRFKVLPPAMGSGQSYEQVYSQAIDADFVIYAAEKISDDTAIPTYQKSVLRRAIDKAERYDEKAYSADSFKTLTDAIADGKAYYDSLGSKDAGTDATVSEQIKAKANAIETAIANLKENTDLADARTALKAVIDEASKVEQGDKTDSAFQTLQAAISTAQAEYAKSNTTVDALKAAAETLKVAVETFNNSGTASELDKNNLKPGDYTVHIDMFNASTPDNPSMSDKAVDHTAKLTVEEDGKYYITVNFKGMTIPLGGQEYFGYLKDLYYYADGYQIGFGIQGDLLPATVLSTIKDKDGNPATDDYNVDADGKVLYEYPEALRFELVNTALKNEQGYVALQVFVPVMDSITPGSGTQNVLMRVDWSSLAVDTTAADKAAAQTVTDQIGALGDITSLDQKEAVTAARAAYDALTDAQKAYVSADTLKVLAAAEDSIAKLEAEAEAEQTDRDAAAKVDAQIAALPAVDALTLDDQAAVTEARAAYTNLSERAQGYVTSLSALEAAEAQIEVLKAEAADEAVAQTVVAQINALGDITDLSQADKVAAARAAYNGLTEAQKAYVSADTLKVLEAAEAKIDALQAAKEEADKAAAQVVVDQINALGSIESLDQEAAVSEARAAYNALTADQKALVSEEALNALIQAENTILDLKQQVVDQEKADAVTEAIEALKAADELTLDDKAAVEAARAAYSALSADQKALISDDILKVLTDAEERIAELVAAANPQTEDQDNNQNQQQNVGGNKLPQNSLTGNKQTAGTGNVGTGVTGTDTAAVSALGLVALAGALAFARKARKDN
ncbi:MAG: NEAT domain-containing protein, partial [Eubacterium sp.]|nr:NEAT domain-containing protein [Eubacterium sp.]